MVPDGSSDPVPVPRLEQIGPECFIPLVCIVNHVLRGFTADQVG